MIIDLPKISLNKKTNCFFICSGKMKLSREFGDKFDAKMHLKRNYDYFHYVSVIECRKSYYQTPLRRTVW